MTATAYTKAARTLVAAGTSNAPGATTRGVIDLRTALFGVLTVKITNGAIGPTAQCTASVLFAHNDGPTPAAASAGADWKTIAQIAVGGTTANAIAEQSFEVHGAMHLEVEFAGNTGQAVTVEAYLSETSNSITA